MSENNSILKEIKVLNEINEKIKRNIKILYVFRTDFAKINVISVTNEDIVYCFGTNYWGVLGFGHQNPVNEPTINEDLSHKLITDFKHSLFHMIARTEDGKLYGWGANLYLGNGTYDGKISKPEVNKYFMNINENIIDMCCGDRHTVVLTSNYKVYAWGENNKGQIGIRSAGIIITEPFKVDKFNGEKVRTITCGSKHSLALTESGCVYSWGSNVWGQLGLDNRNTEKYEPKQIQIEFKFKKISCGFRHSLLLSHEGDIYVFGWNEMGQLGVPEPKKLLTPFKLNNENKFIDIATHFQKNVSIALSEKGIIFIWGKYSGVDIYRQPLESQFKSIHEVFANYFQITSKTLHFERNTGNGEYNRNFYELSIIAIGSFGIVCKAIEKKNNKVFAIKKIPFEKDFEEKALKEIKVMLKLKSDYIVGYENVWIDDNYLKSDDFIKSESSSLKFSNGLFNANKKLLLHIQMELCLKTLEEFLKQLSDELNQKRSQVMTPSGYYISSELFIEILESVDYLHKNDIIHRDLKPKNILITDGKNGRFVKIADFGLATTHQMDEQSHTKYVSTPKYRAPEVFSGNKYDFKVDIYSLGIIIQDVFNIDINERIGKNTELQQKYMNIHNWMESMTALKKDKRPNCHQVLVEKNSWALSLNELQMTDEFKSKTSNFSDKIFHLFFLNTKINKTKHNQKTVTENQNEKT